MTLYCTECHVEWWPYMAKGGICPQCGRGTVRHNHGTATDGVVDLHKAALIVRESADRVAQFEVDYLAREIAILHRDLDEFGGMAA